MEEYKNSKFDYKKQKELLGKYIGQNIIYNGLSILILNIHKIY